jgi:hypothetical protein
MWSRPGRRYSGRRNRYFSVAALVLVGLGTSLKSFQLKLEPENILNTVVREIPLSYWKREKSEFKTIEHNLPRIS